MRIVQIKDITISTDLFPKRPEGMDPVRSNGVHLTDVIRNIGDTAGINKTVSGSMWAPEQLDLAAEVGFMWEEILSAALKERLPCRLDEVEKDGIVMSPDGIEEENGEVILSEYKCVWQSCRRSPADVWKWMMQIKGYCAGLGLTSVKMYILYLNGDWRGSGPQYKQFRIDFTELEIQETWEMIVNHARSIGWIK